MVDTQHFCLRWNNYQSSITSAFENLRDDEDFVDVTLACDGKSLKAHRVVLSACSPYFRELLKVRTPRPSRAPIPSAPPPRPRPRSSAGGARETRDAGRDRPNTARRPAGEETIPAEARLPVYRRLVGGPERAIVSDP